MTERELRTGHVVKHQGRLIEWNIYIIPKECEPVGLTKDILRLCGFVPDQKQFTSQQSVNHYKGVIGFQMNLQHDVNGFYWLAGQHIKIYLRWVHELQELFYAVNKAELRHNLLDGKITIWNRLQ